MEIKKNFNISSTPSEPNPSCYWLIIKNLLNERFAIIQQQDIHKTHPEQQLNLLKQNYESLMTIYHEHKKDFPPILRHFIEQQSYVKAFDFINEALELQNKTSSSDKN